VGIPFGIAGVLLGISFGVVAEPVIGPESAIAMSLLVFAGAAQAAAVAVLAAGGGAETAIAAGVMLQLRYMPMGVAVARWLPGGRFARALQAQALLDPSWAAAHVGGGRFDPKILLGASIAQYPGWVLGTIAGVLGSHSIGDPKAIGLDAIFPAFFLGLLWHEAESSPVARVTALVGAAIAFALTPFLPAGLPILLASAAALVGARIR
jgi:predicted branched-subunit amino acid permease